MHKLLNTSLLILMVSQLVPAKGIEDRTNWGNLKELGPGDEIKIVLNDAKAYRGQFQYMSDEAIVIRTTAGEQTLPRGAVLRVSTKGPSHRGRNALIGLATGAGAGVIVGVASPELGQGTCASGSCVNATSVSVGAVVGSTIGAGIGAALPTGGWRDVYRAR